MSRFKELNDGLMEVISRLTESQELCKLLYYQSDNPLSEPDIENPFDSLFMKNILPIPKVPNVNKETESYLTIIFDDMQIGRVNEGFKNAVLSFNILCHIDKWKLNGNLRPYLIMSKIDELFNNQRVVGFRKMHFESSRFFAVNDKYFGYRVDYNITDFN